MTCRCQVGLTNMSIEQCELQKGCCPYKAHYIMIWFVNQSMQLRTQIPT